MRCPSCRRLHDVSAECVSESDVSPSDAVNFEPSEDPTREFELSGHNHQKASPSRLIEFPGSRTSMPVWRKELAERVREAQERKARESASTDLETVEGQTPTPQLELLPQTESAPINPLVAAALKRIERAHMDQAQPVVNNRALAAVAYARNNYEPVVEPATHSTVAVLEEPSPVETQVEAPIVEEVEPRATTLVVVPPVTTVAEATQPAPPRISKSRKIISDDVNNPALNYLDAVPTTVRVDRPKNSASALHRIVAGLLDLVLLTLLYSPIALGLELLQGNWRNPQVMALAIGSLFFIGFVYFTICTALTGRTFGLRLLGLRIVDVRTGLIPTGSQSASRSFLYVFSLLSAGVLFLGVLFDSDHRTPHERLSRTAVVTA